jgi:hypothetical protein
MLATAQYFKYTELLPFFKDALAKGTTTKHFLCM